MSAPSASTAASAPSAITLLSLADVELQLCLQSLDNRSRVMAARCSRRLLNAASRPFTWRFAEPFVVSELMTAGSVARLNSLTSLQRFAPLTFRLRVTNAAGLVHLASATRLTALDMRALPAWAHIADQLMRADVQQRLRSLWMPRMDSCSPAHNHSNLLAAACLPRLHSFAGVVMEGNAVIVRQFACADTLTSLALQLNWEAKETPPLAGFSTLHRLSLSHSYVTDALLTHAFTSAPRLCSSLSHLDFNSILLPPRRERTPLPALEVAFASLTALHTLVLRGMDRVGHFLPAAARIPALRSLVICLPEGTDFMLAEFHFLSCAGVKRLLRAAPLLHVRLLCQEHSALLAYLAQAPPRRLPRGLGHLCAIASLTRVHIDVYTPSMDSELFLQCDG